MPGGFYFQLKDTSGGSQEVTEETAGKVAYQDDYRAAEAMYLSRLAEGERLVIEDILDERALLDATELVLNCHFSQAATKKALDILKNGTVGYAAEPTLVAEGQTRAQKDQQTIENQRTVIDQQTIEIERLSLIVTQQLGIIQGLGETTA